MIFPFLIKKDTKFKENLILKLILQVVQVTTDNASNFVAAFKKRRDIPDIQDPEPQESEEEEEEAEIEKRTAHPGAGRPALIDIDNEDNQEPSMVVVDDLLGEPGEEVQDAAADCKYIVWLEKELKPATIIVVLWASLCVSYTYFNLSTVVLISLFLFVNKCNEFFLFLRLAVKRT